MAHATVTKPEIPCAEISLEGWGQAHGHRHWPVIPMRICGIGEGRVVELSFHSRTLPLLSEGVSEIGADLSNLQK